MYKHWHIHAFHENIHAHTHDIYSLVRRRQSVSASHRTIRPAGKTHFGWILFIGNYLRLTTFVSIYLIYIYITHTTHTYTQHTRRSHELNRRASHIGS